MLREVFGCVIDAPGRAVYEGSVVVDSGSGGARFLKGLLVSATQPQTVLSLRQTCHLPLQSGISLCFSVPQCRAALIAPQREQDDYLSMSSSDTAPLERGAIGPLRKQPSKSATSWAVSRNSGSQGHWKNMKYQDLRAWLQP